MHELSSKVWAMSGAHLAPLMARLRSGTLQIATEEPADFRRRLYAGKPAAAELVMGTEEMGCAAYRVGSVAVLPIQSSFLYHGRSMMYDWFGGLSYQCVAMVVAVLANDATIEKVLLDINCPGGTVDGVTELSAAIKDLAAKKNVIALTHDLAASAAYWACCSAAEFVSTETGEVGSVGVWMEYFDDSKFYEEAGVRPVLISTGDLKAIGAPGVPITADQEKSLRRRVDDPFALFVADVSAGRGIAPEVVKGWRGACFTAQEALERGVIDSIESVQSVMDRLLGRSATRPEPVNVDQPGDGPEKETPEDSASASNTDGDAVAKEFDMDLKSLKRDQLAAENPGLVETIKAEGRAEAKPAPASIKELKAAFPNDAEFALDCAEQGKSVLEAKAEQAGRLAATVEKLQGELKVASEKLAAETAKVAKLEADAKAAKRGARGVEPIPGESGKEASSQSGDYMELVTAKAADLKAANPKLTDYGATSMAHSAVQRENPEAHAAWLGKTAGKK